MDTVLHLDDLTVVEAAESVRGEALKRVLRELVVPPGPEGLDDETGRGVRPARLNVIQRRPHSAILITARRGDGKTTFLTHLLHLIEGGRRLYADQLPEDVDRDAVARLYSLGILDPTLIESKQNIVVMIVDRIRDATDRLAMTEPGRDAEHQDLRKALRALASGLTLLDGIGSDELYGRDWADPDYVLQQGLDRARAADEFERSLYAYVNKACRFLEIDAFVIAIDDVDTAFDRGWPVLEALRKYLATDRLRVVLSGDLGLYNMLVRREQWRQITPHFVEAERALPAKLRRAERLAHLVEELQDQYLVKVVPPDRRVELLPLAELVQNGGLKFRLGRVRWDPLIFTRRMARDIVRASLPADQDAFAYAILRLPLRSAIRILQGGLRAMEGGDLKAFEALRRVLSTILLNRDLDASKLTDPDPRRVIRVVADWLTYQGRWGSGARFTADTGDDEYDLVAIVVAAGLVRTFRGRIDAMLEFGLRVSAVREKAEREALDEAGLQHLMRHLWPSALEGPVRYVSRLAAWDVGRSDTYAASAPAVRMSGTQIALRSVGGFDAAFMRLYGMTYSRIGTDYVPMDRKAFGYLMTSEDREGGDRLLNALPPPVRTFHATLRGSRGSIYQASSEPYFAYVNSLETLRAGLRSEAAAILMLGVCRTTGVRRTEVCVFSVLRLIATVAEFAGMSHEGVDDEIVAASIEGLLNEAELFRSFPSPGQRARPAEHPLTDVIDDDGPDDFASRGSSATRDRRVAFSELMAVWLRQPRPGEDVASPQTISRMWTRFTYAFDGIRTDLVEGRSPYLGVLVHRTIIAFLHAVGVEALRAVQTIIGTVAYRNPIASAQPFQRLLDLIYSGDTALDEPEVAFFDRVFTCPLWGYFLARSDEDIGVAGRTDYVTRIMSTYFDRMNGMRNGTEGLIDNSAFAVRFGHPPTPGSNAQFTGFFALLNTVPIQDHAVRPRRPDLALAEIVGMRPTPQVRRRRVRIDEGPSGT